MQLAVLSDAQAREVFRSAMGDTQDARLVAADLLRHEASARGRSPRHFLLGRVSRLAAPAMALEPELVDGVCEELERQGDILLAEGGIVYPAPARIVALGDGTFRFVCAVPSARLFAAVEGEWMRLGVRRDCRLLGSPEHAAQALGGVIVTTETWAGLDRTPAADSDWLRALEDRLSWKAEPEGSLEREEPLSWSGFLVDQDEPRWRASGPAQLWRARHRFQGWVYAWSAGESPRAEPFVTLYPDEGARTAYAVARALDKPFRGSLAYAGGDVTMTIAGWLPRAEYRYLSTCAEPVETSGRGSTWTMPAVRAERVIHTIEARLGVRLLGKAT